MQIFVVAESEYKPVVPDEPGVFRLLPVRFGVDEGVAEPLACSRDAFDVFAVSDVVDALKPREVTADESGVRGREVGAVFVNDEDVPLSVNLVESAEVVESGFAAILVVEVDGVLCERLGAGGQLFLGGNGVAGRFENY